MCTRVVTLPTCKCTMFRNRFDAETKSVLSNFDDSFHLEDPFLQEYLELDEMPFYPVLFDSWPIHRLNIC